MSILSSDGFVPEAVEAARAEFERRNLNPSEVARISAQIYEAQQQEEAKADLPLSTNAKLAFLAFGVLIFWSITAATMLRTRGYERKGREAFKWILGSFLFYAVVSVTFPLINYLAG